MAEQITLKKRLIGKEDINFDITGTGEQEYFFTADGGKKNVSKINASHLPLTTDTRSEVNAVNVDEALSQLNRKVEGFSASDALGEDLEIIFENEDDFETIQNKINQQKKNLGGHTLKFVFPASLSQNLYSTLVWQDFYNGTLIITGGSENSPVAVYDRQDINSLFRIYRCQCEVLISNFYFVHQYSMYGVAVESSSATVIKDCNFSGIADADSYAVYSLVSNISLINCLFADESETEKEENEAAPDNTGMGKSLGEIFAYPGATPPEGAYLLNGQTIHNCETLYPKFWQWLTENAGDMVETPVYKPWTMPSLSADGTAGGVEYAVAASGEATSGYNAYKSFDGTHGGEKTYANVASAKSGSLTWYSPVKLKFTRLLFQNPTNNTSNASYKITSFEIFGSNDGSVWDSLVSGTYGITANSATQIVDIPESKFNADNPGYQYLKIEAVNGGGNNTDFPEITIYGQEYLYTDYAGNGNILTLSNDAYEYTLSRTGVCGGFVINSIAGSVRLPTLINGTLWGADSSNIGQSLAAGLPNITANWKSEPSGDAHGAVSVAKESGNIQAVSEGGSEDSRLSFDASRSSSVYGNSDTVQPPAIRVSWCIQVFNAATALSEQESAQLASQMQMKAQTDFANVSENLDFVVESWNDGNGNWYRKYRSGWVEQGGVITGTVAGDVVITLFVEMEDAYYNATMMFADPTGYASAAFDGRYLSTYARTTTSFKTYASAVAGVKVKVWSVKGQAAN